MRHLLMPCCCCCPLLPAVARCCLLLPVAACCCLLLPILVPNSRMSSSRCVYSCRDLGRIAASILRSMPCGASP